MRNLAGDKRSNASIHDELEAAEIEIVEVPEPYGEPHATLIGKLGPFTFRRAWYYWMVEGPVPVAVAMELYEHPIGRKDVRVGGHCGCPSPLDYGARWMTGDGRRIHCEVFTQEQRESEFMRDIVAKIEAEEVYSADPPNHPGAVGFVDSYHIDSARGLRLFADTIRKHGLDKVKP